jgi:hypothetical protein
VRAGEEAIFFGAILGSGAQEKRGLGHSDHGGMMGASKKAKPLASRKVIFR